MPTENPRAEEAFAFYASLDPKARKYALVAEKLGVNLTTVKRWASKGGWRGRLEDRELRVARKTADRLEAGEVSSRSRQVRLVELAIMQLVKGISDGAVRGSFGDLDRLVRLEGFLKGTDKTLPVEEVHRIFEYFLRSIEQEIHDPAQRLRIADAVRHAIEAAQSPRQLGTNRHR